MAKKQKNKKTSRLDRRNNISMAGLVVLGLVLAVIGISMTISSRAGGDTIIVSAQNNCQTNTAARLVTEQAANNKNDQLVCQFASGTFKSSAYSVPGVGTVSYSRAKSFLTNREYTTAKTCAFVRALEANTTVDLHAFGDTNADRRNVPVRTDKYYEVCGTASLQASADQNGGVTVKTGSVRVSSILVSGDQKDDEAPPVGMPNGSFPTAATTGFAGAGLSLSQLTPRGSINITTSGTVIDRADINGCVTVSNNASNVTIKRSRIRCSGHGILTTDAGSNIQIQDVTLIGTSDNTPAGVYGNNFTCLRCDISQFVDGIKTGNNVKVLDSYIHDMRKKPGSHNDGIQNSGGASNILIRGNRIMGPFQTSTSAIIAQTNVGPINNMIIENNYLHGGSYTVYLRDKGTGYGSPTNSAVRNNVFVKGSTGVYLSCFRNGGTPSSCNIRKNFLLTSGVSVTGNTFEDGTSL